MKATISDIALMAQVSKSTVSRYLNGGYVSAATSEKIEAVIKETKYEPNSFAQSLKLKKTNFIGVIIPRLDSYTMTKMLMGIDERLKELGFQMLVANTDQILDREVENIHAFARQKVAGIILMATRLTSEHNEAFEDAGIPALIIGQESDVLHSIVHADYEAGFDLGQFVYKKGHRSVTYIGVTEQDEAVGRKRKQGFLDGLQAGGPHSVNCVEADFSMERAKLVTENALNEHIPDLIVCATDNMALGAMKAIHEKKLAIPKDLSVAGFGGYRISEMVHPGLTTVSFHYFDVGLNAAFSMVSLIEGKSVQKKMISGYEIISRESIADRNHRA
ncbi:LacI family transcriptional regulator [Bacillus sp. FJAT-42376]|uniref:LacI family DNA-binding transcriptional regulator n=1 Tax=Bacillus sp. FJAT-42376 TaxID=2014076 RepID=UPI000F508D08|nr:LacI family DNA-binding transcriptional regulator [Bacillus sp. FJAT-42376]AZB43170.1 LacI family transcriptional regulator [Bacillus sp. FJAT-42376]